jgi:acetylornithine deacetylase/succinyl-diaminopimelate desuccinylase-like protein
MRCAPIRWPSALYKELVETDTSITTGCTLLADKVEKHCARPAMPTPTSPALPCPITPRRRPGGDPARQLKTLKPILLLGHLDVVVAKREDWTRDPYTLIEEGGYFYGRGTSDMKAMDAIWIDMMMRQDGPG